MVPPPPRHDKMDVFDAAAAAAPQPVAIRERNSRTDGNERLPPILYTRIVLVGFTY